MYQEKMKSVIDKDKNKSFQQINTTEMIEIEETFNREHDALSLC